MVNAVSSNFVVDQRSFIEVENLANYDYQRTKLNVDQLFAKYRSCKQKQEIIQMRTNSALSMDNLGIFSNTVGDPVGNKIEQLEKYTQFIETVEKTYQLYFYQLTKDEQIIFEKKILLKNKDFEVMEMMNVSSKTTYYTRIRSTYIKVARWYDLEECIEDFSI